MIQEEICTYKVANLAKEKGFDGSGCLKHYDQNGLLRSNRSFSRFDLTIDELYKHDAPSEVQVYAPTQSLLQRWLREEKGIVIDVVLDWQYNIEVEEIRYQYRIGSKRRMTIEGVQTRGIVRDRYFDTYELALEDALKYALENLV